VFSPLICVRQYFPQLVFPQLEDHTQWLCMRQTIKNWKSVEATTLCNYSLDTMINNDVNTNMWWCQMSQCHVTLFRQSEREGWERQSLVCVKRVSDSQQIVCSQACRSWVQQCGAGSECQPGLNAQPTAFNHTISGQSMGAHSRAHQEQRAALHSAQRCWTHPSTTQQHAPHTGLPTSWPF